RRIHCERHGIEFVKRVAVAVPQNDGRRLPKAQIDDDVVRSLRWHYWSVTKDFKSIACAHGLSVQRVQNIIRRQSWCEVEPIEAEFGHVITWGGWTRKISRPKSIRSHVDLALVVAANKQPGAARRHRRPPALPPGH